MPHRFVIHRLRDRQKLAVELNEGKRRFLAGQRPLVAVRRFGG